MQNVRREVSKWPKNHIITVTEQNIFVELLNRGFFFLLLGKLPPLDSAIVSNNHNLFRDLVVANKTGSEDMHLIFVRPTTNQPRTEHSKW
jgi:hypothetical protein